MLRCGMQTELLDALRARQPEIRTRWAALLCVEPVNTPLAHPGALAHLIRWTLEEIFMALAHGASRERVLHPRKAAERSGCACGRNPLFAYFATAEQVMREALVLVQAEMPTLDPIERDASLAELNLALQGIAQREIDAFCGVCLHRQANAEQSHDPARESANANIAEVRGVAIR